MTMWKDLLKHMVEEDRFDLSVETPIPLDVPPVPFDVAENYLEALRLSSTTDDPDMLSSISNVRMWRRACRFGFHAEQATLSPSISVVMLGTAAAAPTKTRNCSSIFVDLPDGGVLLDCGEGTFGQLVMYCGDENKAKNIVQNIRMIWISHHHLDHHVGLWRLIEIRNALKASPPLLIIGPSSIGQFLSSSKSWGKTLRYRFYDARNFNTLGKIARAREIMSEWIVDILSVPVIHCNHAFGAVLTLRTCVSIGFFFTWTILKLNSQVRINVSCTRETRDHVRILFKPDFVLIF